MAAAVEIVGSGGYVWTPAAETRRRRWRVTGCSDADTALSTVGVSYGDAHPDDSDLRANECYVQQAVNAQDVWEVEIVYRARTRSTREEPGQTRDEYIAETYYQPIYFAEDANNAGSYIVVGPDGDGFSLERGRIIWHRTQWRTSSNHSTVEPLLWSLNNATFNGFAAETLLFVGYSCRELGNNYWQADYQFRIDTVDYHRLSYYLRDPETGLADTAAEKTVKLYEAKDWSNLFT